MGLELNNYFSFLTNHDIQNFSWNSTDFSKNSKVHQVKKILQDLDVQEIQN